jgi:hypothetical protein
MSAPAPACAELLATARRGLLEATLAETPAERYAAAHLAALRAAAAVLAARAQPSARRSGPRSVWALVPRVAPEFAEWAQFFAAGSAKRSLAAAGVSVVTMREADDLLRDAETFCDLIATGLSGHLTARQASLPATG